MFVYVNQRNVTPVKGDLAIFLDYVILGQLIPARNKPKDTEECECLPNEVNIVVPLYDVESSKFLGLENRLAFIMVRGDQDETFFSYGYDKAKSNTLNSASKKVLPNIFSGICFKKHQDFLLE